MNLLPLCIKQHMIRQTEHITIIRYLHKMIIYDNTGKQVKNIDNMLLDGNKQISWVN